MPNKTTLNDVATVNNIFFLLSFFWPNLTLFNKTFILVDLPSFELSTSNLNFEMNLFLTDGVEFFTTIFNH